MPFEILHEQYDGHFRGAKQGMSSISGGNVSVSARDVLKPIHDLHPLRYETEKEQYKIPMGRRNAKTVLLIWPIDS